MDGNEKQNKTQVTFSSKGQTGDLGASNIIKMSISKIYIYQTFCESSQIKDRNILNRIFILLLRSCPGVGLGCWAWGFAMAPHRLRALVALVLV